MLNTSKLNIYLFLYYTFYAWPLLTAVSNHSVISNVHVHQGRTECPVPTIDIHNPKPPTTTMQRYVQRTSSCFFLPRLQYHQHQPGTQNISRNKLHYLTAITIKNTKHIPSELMQEYNILISPAEKWSFLFSTLMNSIQSLCHRVFVYWEPCMLVLFVTRWQQQGYTNHKHQRLVLYGNVRTSAFRCWDW